MAGSVPVITIIISLSHTAVIVSKSSFASAFEYSIEICVLSNRYAALISFINTSTVLPLSAI